MVVRFGQYTLSSIASFRVRLLLLSVALLLLLYIYPVFHLSTPTTAESTIPAEHDTWSDPTFPTPVEEQGSGEPPGEPLSRSLVLARTAKESVSWATEDPPLTDDGQLTLFIYTVDDENATLSVPINKGHEVMPYLTHIITNYANLTDITLFMHGHRSAWHNNDILDSDSKWQVRSLNWGKVVREGYMNLRCHRSPGCPDYIHPGNPSTEKSDQLTRPEEEVFGQAWLELFPDDTAPPNVLSQPCCGQFAVTRERILTLPLERYVSFRQWLIDTPLGDWLSGRVWEYIWQYVFAGVHELCPEEHVCYCDGYGVCFGGRSGFERWFTTRERWRHMLKERDRLGDAEDQRQQIITSQMEILQAEMDWLKASALERGKNPKYRAAEAGWA